MAGKEQISLASKNGLVASLTGSSLTVVVSQAVLATSSARLSLRIGGADNQFVYNPTQQKYYANISLPAAGTHEAYLGRTMAVGELILWPLKFNLCPMEPLAAKVIYFIRAR